MSRKRARAISSSIHTIDFEYNAGNNQGDEEDQYLATFHNSKKQLTQSFSYIFCKVLHDPGLLPLIISYCLNDDKLGQLYRSCLVDTTWASIINGSSHLWIEALGLDWVFSDANHQSDAFEFLRRTKGPLSRKELLRFVHMDAVESDFERRNIGLEFDPTGILNINYGIFAFEHVRLDENLAVLVVGHEKVTDNDRYASLTTLIIDIPQFRSDMKKIEVNEIFDMSTSQDSYQVTYWPNAMIRLKNKLKRSGNIPSTFRNSNLLTILNVSCCSSQVPFALNLLSLKFTSTGQNVPAISYFDELQLCSSQFDKEANTIFTTGVGGQNIVQATTRGDLLPPVMIQNGKLKGTIVGFGNPDKAIKFKKQLDPPIGKLNGPSSDWNKSYFIK